jgi:hypothetical protein
MRKSMSYVLAQVAAGNARRVVDTDITAGIICRGFLAFGPRELPPDTNLRLAPAELPGLHFEEPLSAKLGRNSNCPMLRFLQHSEIQAQNV